MPDILSLIGRTEPLFSADISLYEKELSNLVASSRFLVIGGAGSIGSAVVYELFKRNPKLLHVVDISENNMVETVSLPHLPLTAVQLFLIPLYRTDRDTIMF
jgi:FlaA1/EpsC-like NDP-sugar epimerase